MLSIEYTEKHPIEMVDSEEIIKRIYEMYPHIIFFPRLLLFEGFSYTNDAIVDYLSETELFEDFFDENYVAVYEDCSFAYDYGSISSTHTSYAHLGYANRTHKLEEIIRERNGYLWC